MSLVLKVIERLFDLLKNSAGAGARRGYCILGPLDCVLWTFRNKGRV